MPTGRAEDAAPSVPRAWGSHHLEAFGPRGCGTRTCLSRVDRSGGVRRSCTLELERSVIAATPSCSRISAGALVRCARGRDRSGQRPGRATSTDMGLRLRRRGRPRALRQTESPRCRVAHSAPSPFRMPGATRVGTPFACTKIPYPTIYTAALALRRSSPRRTAAAKFVDSGYLGLARGRSTPARVLLDGSRPCRDLLAPAPLRRGEGAFVVPRMSSAKGQPSVIRRESDFGSRRTSHQATPG